MLDVIVYVPLSIWFLSFWIFVVTLDRGPAVLFDFYAGSRTATDKHCGDVLFGSVFLALYSGTLFLPKRQLFSAIGRRGTIVLAVCLVLLAIATFFAAAFCGVGM